VKIRQKWIKNWNMSPILTEQKDIHSVIDHDLMKLQENMQDIISNAKIFEKLCWVRDLI
jgi:hypothetical protein